MVQHANMPYFNARSWTLHAHAIALAHGLILPGSQARFNEVEIAESLTRWRENPSESHHILKN